MRKIFTSFKKNTNVKVGITAEEFEAVRAALQCEYAEANHRQKTLDAQPNKYMKGLKFAIDLLNDVKPHAL